GFFRWIVPTNQPPGDYPVTVHVVDSGTPPRGDSTSFTVSVRSTVTITTVAPPPFIQTITAPAGQATFTIATSLGHTYRVEYKDELSAVSWTQFDRDFVAAGPYCSLSDFVISPHRFYRIYLVE